MHLKLNNMGSTLRLVYSYSTILRNSIQRNINNVHLVEKTCKYCGNTFYFNEYSKNKKYVGNFCDIKCVSKYYNKIRREKLDKLNSKLVNNQDAKEYISKYHYLCYWGVKEYNLPFEDVEDVFYSKMMDIIRRAKQLKLTNEHKNNYIIKSIKLCMKSYYINNKNKIKEISFDDLHPIIKGRYIEEVEWEK